MKKVKIVLVALLLLVLARTAFQVTYLNSLQALKNKVIYSMAIDYGVFGLIPTTYDLKVGEVDVNMDNLVLLFISDQADSNDTIVFHINSPGGRADIMTMIINHISTSKAHTISKNESMAASAAGLIAMVTDEIKADPLCVYLFHRGHYPDGTKVPLDDPVAIAVQDFVDVYVFPYLTEKEKADYIAGVDIWIGGSTLIKRIAEVRGEV
jgi:hypothetical protein